MITVTGGKTWPWIPTPLPGILPLRWGRASGGRARILLRAYAVESTRIDGNDAFIAFLGCGMAGNRGGKPCGKTTIIVMMGLRDYCTVQWAERAAASTTPLAFDKTK